MEEVKETSERSKLTPIIGAIGHCARYFKKHQSVHHNPHFNKDTAHPVVIYCIHGTADRASSFDNFAKYLVADLPDFISMVRLVAFKDRAKGISIFDFARQLKDQIIINHDKHVILLGHSRGGLIISHLAEYLAKENSINVLLLGPLCAPYRGSYLAFGPIAYLSNSVNEMRVASDYGTELSNAMKQSSHRYIFVGANKDKVVDGLAFLPYHVQPEAENVLLLKNHGHLSAMSERAMWAFVHGHIKSLAAPVVEPAHPLSGIL